MRIPFLLALSAGSLFAQTAPLSFSFPTPPGPVIIYRTQVANEFFFASGATPGYTWSITSGTPPTGTNFSTSTNPYTQGAGLLQGTPTVLGTFPVTIQVDDAGPGGPISASFNIIVRDPIVITSPPAAVAWTVGQVLTFPTTATGGAGPPYYFGWDEGAQYPPQGWFNFDFQAALFTVTPADVGTFVYRLRASTEVDPGSGTKDITFTINAQPAIGPQFLGYGQTGTPFSSTIGRTGGTAPFTWSISPGNLPNGLFLNTSTGAITGTPTVPGTFNFTANVVDAAGATASQALSIQVASPLTITSTSPLPTATQGGFYSLQLTGTGGIPGYFWSAPNPPAGMTLSSSGLLSGTASTATTYIFSVFLSDSREVQVSKVLALTVAPPISITTGSTLAPTTAGRLTTRTLASVGGAPPITWSIFIPQLAALKGPNFASGPDAVPAGMNLSAGGVLSGTPTTPGLYTFDVRAQDSQNVSAFKSFSITVNETPTFTIGVVPQGLVGQPFSKPLSGSGGTTPYVWSAAGLPAGLGINPSTGLISGTPTVSVTAQVTVTLTDAAGATAQRATTIDVASQPVIQSAVLPLAKVNSPYTFGFNATGGRLPLTWAVKSGSVGTGMSLSSAGVLSGTPTAAGTNTFTIEVTDALGQKAQALVSFEVALSLVIQSAVLPAGTVNGQYTFGFSAIGGKPPLTWGLKSGSPGVGMTFSSAGVLSGTPTTQGSYPFTVDVTDSLGQNAQASFTFTVNGTPYIITGPALPGATQGSAYSTKLEAGGGSQPYTFAISAGTAPAGITVNNQGVLSGTPTAAGAFAFTVQITDAGGSTNTRAMLLTVNPALTITTATPLPSGTVGAAYAQSLEAAGGTAPRTWSVVSGSLPGGLALSAGGAFSGAPLAAGAFGFTARVTDANGATAQKAFTLVTTEGFSVGPQSFVFTGISGGPQTAQQNLSLVSTPPNGTVKLKTTVPWLSVAAQATTPALVAIGADPKNLAPGTYDTTITVEGPTVSPVAVKFIVGAAATGQFTADPSGVNLATTKNGPSTTGLITLTALSPGIAYTAVAQTDVGGWLQVSPGNGTLQPETPVSLLVTANPTGLEAGTYKGRVQITAPGSGQQILVPVNMVVSPKEKSLFLSFNGFTFRAVKDGPAPTAQEVLVLNAGNGTLDWTAAKSGIGGAVNWLTISPASGKSTFGQPSAFTVSVDPTGLAVGEYYGQIDVAAAGADGSPQSVTVVLEVRNESPGPEVIPSGVIFTAAPGGPDPTAQKVKVVNLTKNALTFVTSSSTEIEPNWIEFTPKQGSLAASGTTELTVSAKIAGLPAGVRRGAITLQFSDGSIRVIDLALVLPSSLAVTTSSKNPSAGSCAPTKLVPVFTTLGTGFSVSAGWPIPIQLKVVDDCGDAISQGSVTTSFSTGDPALTMTSLRPGDWSTTWTPKRALAETLTITGSTRNQPGTLLGTVKATGSLKPNANPPVIAASGVLSAASYTLDAPIGVGSLVAIFGERFAENLIVAPTTPLPTTLGDTQVIVAGRLVPLQFVSGSQINVIVPYETEFNARQQVIVRRGAALTTPEPVVVAQAQPGVFTANATGKGQGIVVDVTNKLIDTSNPTKAGDVVIVYCTGLGEVSPSVPAGSPAPLDSLSTVVAPVKITVGGVNVPQVLFAGLAPGFVGLYQVNLVIPQGVPVGDAVPVVITAADQIGSAVTIAVK